MATVSGININTTGNPLLEGSLRSPTQTLGQGDFLKLLVAQMSQQDPMNPMKDTEFIAQMASFSALEQSKAMQQDMAQLRASTMLGETVKLKKTDGTTTTGVVGTVEFSEGKPYLIVDGARYEVGDVLAIVPAQTTTPETDSSRNSG